MNSSQLFENLGSPPAADEFELTLFGPGVGECILMHFGNGEWFVVDSCVFAGSKSPVVTDYLDAMGVDPKKAVRGILATHWHDDHVAGLSKLVRRCPDAFFVISGALEPSQFFSLILEVEERNKLVKATSTATEFATILDDKLESGRQRHIPDMLASDGSRLYQGGFCDLVSVQALSPSAATIQATLSNLARQLCTDMPTRKFRRFSPNDLSVALQVSAGPIDILLKADLEDCPQPQVGWKAVLQSPFRPKKKSQMVKVGHHGSSNADNDQVWADMIESKPWCVVTPYSKLKEPLPREADLARLSGRTDELYVTSSLSTGSRIKRRGLERQIAAATRIRRPVNRQSGFVRIRFGLGRSPIPDIQLFGAAHRHGRVS
ncbi:MAG: MBL fold metallo-hydrolase [Fuerstiella sp.]